MLVSVALYFRKRYYGGGVTEPGEPKEVAPPMTTGPVR